MAIEVTPDDQPVIERLKAAIQASSVVELQLGQLEDAVMAEFDEQSLPNTRLALAAAHVAGLILTQHGVEEPMRAALQTDLAMLLMKRFRTASQ